ncbi:unnamed protein product [Discula destructiva]
MHRLTLASAVGALLALAPSVSAGLYSKSSPVIQVNGKNYDNLIAKSNYTSIVEFYAPWCGHCKNLQPAYEKAAKNLEGLAQVAAVDCDDDANKAFCGQFGVQGFPTLKIVRPGSKKGKPVVEDYQGERSAKAIVNAVVDKINNHVKRISDKDIDDFLSTNNETAKALLFTEKGTTTALLKAVAIDFLDGITVGQVRNTQKKAVELFGIEKFPTLVLLPGGDKDGVVYDGDLKKAAIVEFLSQVAAPNPVSGPTKPKPKSKSSKPKKDATTEPEASEPTAEAEEQITEPVDDANIQKPIFFEGALPIPIIHEKEKLIGNCLNQKAKTCVLAFVPKEDQSESAKKALGALAELSHKHSQSKRHLFPMYEVHFEDEYTAETLKALELSPSEVHVVAINARRGWWKLLESTEYSHESIESWIDQIRMGEGTKRKLPEGLVVEVNEAEPAKEATPEASSEPTPAATDNEAPDSSTPTPEVTPDAEVVSDSTASGEEPTTWSGADPTVQEDTAAAEKPTEEAHVKDEL